MNFLELCNSFDDGDFDELQEEGYEDVEDFCEVVVSEYMEIYGLVKELTEAIDNIHFAQVLKKLSKIVDQR